MSDRDEMITKQIKANNNMLMATDRATAAHWYNVRTFWENTIQAYDQVIGAQQRAPKPR